MKGIKSSACGRERMAKDMIKWRLFVCNRATKHAKPRGMFIDCGKQSNSETKSNYVVQTYMIKLSQQFGVDFKDAIMKLTLC